MLDCYGSVGTTFGAFGSIFTGSPAVLFDGSMSALGLTLFDYVILLLGMLTLFAVSMLQRKGSVRARLLSAPFALRAGLLIALFTAVLLFGAYGPGYDVGQFIYNRF